MLTPPQQQLLRALVEAHDREPDGSFSYIRGAGEQGVRVSHEALPQGTLPVRMGDVIALVDDGLIRFFSPGAEDGPFDLTAEAFAAVQAAGNESAPAARRNPGGRGDTPHVFISHETADIALARTLGDHLRLAIPGLSVFLAGDDLRTGADWDEELRSALELSDLVIALMTPNSLNTRWVYFEAGAAFVRGRLFPVCAGGTSKGGLGTPMGLRQARTIEDEADTIALFDDVAATCGLPAGRPSDLRRHASAIVDAASISIPEPDRVVGANVVLLHWEGSNRSEHRGLVVKNVGPRSAERVIGERITPTNVRDGWEYPHLSSEETVGLHQGTARAVSRAELDDGDDPGEVRPGEMKGRVRWRNPDGSLGTSGWQPVHKLP